MSIGILKFGDSVTFFALAGQFSQHYFPFGVAPALILGVLNILLSRAGRDEQALMTTIAGLVVVLVLVIQKISELFDLIKSLFSL